MRAAFPILGVLLLAAGLAACHKPAAAVADDGGRKGLTIQSREAPPPPIPKATGGKLAVMDNPPPPPAAAPAAVQPPPQPTPVADDGARDYNHYRSDPRPGRDPRYDDPGYGADLVDSGPGTLTRRDCRQAERADDPLADSRTCRALLGPRPPPRRDPQLVADCREARAIGDPFAFSPACRAIFGR
jgi:hypothetical protein